eukprot:TRINITY_DN5138_c0_g1_i2.p1 TRINITY_DN5138_c0_g1~~TRINITY_DN5138_c0_g1_i2.p1  ORF type:complete len:151 (+),score=40.74 TRINITY_DN5138_c0_g1_i2:242-694(+)
MEPPIPHLFAEIRTKKGVKNNRQLWKERKIPGVLHGDPEGTGKPELLIYVEKDRLNELSRKGALGDNQKYWLEINGEIELVSPHTLKLEQATLSVYSLSWKRELFITSEEFHNPNHYKLYNKRMANWNKVINKMKEEELKVFPKNELVWD